MANTGTIRKRVRVRLPADPAHLGAGGLWGGMLGIRTGQQLAAAERFVCHAHHDHPHLGRLQTSKGDWWIEVEACCDALMADVEKELGAAED